MRSVLFLIVSIVTWTGSCSNGPASETPDSRRPPNILFILADDLGYGDLGCFGSKKIRTPFIDQLASEGLRLTRHYSGNAVCAPSRCVLMTGLHPGHAFIRNNRTVGEEGQYPIPSGTQTLARRLQDAGYICGAFGKWGLGGPASDGRPLQQGFNRFFGYNCQGVAHNFYPTSLWDDETRLPLRNPTFSAHQVLPDTSDPLDQKSYEQYSGPHYSADIIHAQAVKFIEAHQHRPFFLFVPTTIPHLALQVPEDSLKEYVEVLPDEPYRGNRRYLPHRYPHACYAAMVSRLDRHVGELMAKLDQLRLSENTIVVFSSDNGPAAGGIGGTDSDFFNSSGGLTGRKGSLQEGGIRVPGIVRWKGKVRASTVSHRITGFEDWIPTLSELAHLPLKDAADLDGISFAQELLGNPQPERQFLYREFINVQVVWAGRSKAVRRFENPADSKSPAVESRNPQQVTELYDLEADPQETHNIAINEPEVVSRLSSLMDKEHTPSELFPIQGLDEIVANKP